MRNCLWLGCMLFLKFLIGSHIAFFYLKILFISIVPPFSVTFGAVTMQAFVKFVKSISPDRINMCLLWVSFIGHKLCKGRIVVIWPRRARDINWPGCSVAEHLTSHAGGLGSNSRSSYTFSLVFLSIVEMCISLYIHAFIPPIPTTDLF